MDYRARDFRALFLAEQRAAFTAYRPTGFMVITGIADDWYPPPPRTPLWTRHMLGVIEAERDQRRRRKRR